MPGLIIFVRGYIFIFSIQVLAYSQKLLKKNFSVDKGGCVCYGFFEKGIGLIKIGWIRINNGPLLLSRMMDFCFRCRQYKDAKRLCMNIIYSPFNHNSSMSEHLIPTNV